MSPALALAAGTLTVVAVLLLLPGPRALTFREGPSRPLKERILALRPAAPAGAKPEQAAQLLRQLASLLASGRGEAQAWADLRDHWARTDPDHPFVPVAAQIAAAERSGAGTAEGIRRCLADMGSSQQTPRRGPLGAGREGAAQQQIRRVLSRLLAVTRLSEQTGAPLSELIERLADSLDEAAKLRAAVQTAAAGPRLTQLILTLLPLGGVLLGQLMGANPLAALLGSAAGLGCLALGLLMLLAGRVWGQRMIHAVEARI